MMNFFKTNRNLLWLTSIILSLSFIASLILTSFGTVDVKSQRLDTEKGQFIVYDLFKPKSATSESKAPFIAIIPGFQRSKEALSNIAIELSRRGYVVALIDPYAQGLSSSSLSRIAATTQGYGMFALVEYVHTGVFDFVDLNKVGATGHSMGGNAAIRGADYFGKQVIQNNSKSKLHSVYVSGYVLTLRDNILKNSRSNMGVSYALYDEGAFRNELEGWDSANMQIAPESIRTVNNVLPQDRQITKVELGKYYGSEDKNSLRSAINLGIAMQLTNISRDVTKDEINNRRYINANLETIKSTIFFADKFYDNSFYAMKKIPLSLRFSIIVARRIYRKIGYKIIKIKTFEEYKNSGKIFVNNYEKIIETFLAIFDLIRLTALNNNVIDHNHELIEEEINLNERI